MWDVIRYGTKSVPRALPADCPYEARQLRVFVWNRWAGDVHEANVTTIVIHRKEKVPDNILWPRDEVAL